MKQKVAVVGASGRMGQELARILSNHPTMTAELGISRGNPCPGYSRNSNSFGDIAGVDLVIDFSMPASFSTVLEVCRSQQKPLVSGVTGLGRHQEEELKEAATEIPIFWSPNMSLGVAVLNKALRALGEIKHYDFQIEELHHSQKKDSPSGTALQLQKNLTAVVGKDLPAPVSIRGGGIFGVHKVYAMSDEDVLIFEHQALNRGVFAKGAIRAAEWLITKPAGLYSMRDLV